MSAGAWVGIASAVTFLVSLVALPIVIGRMPQDHFVRRRRPAARRRSVHVVAFVLRNALGVLLVLAGVAMLLLPGQGVLAILVGASLVDFPGKRELERRLVRLPRVLRAMNWIRKRMRKPPLLPPSDNGDDDGDERSS